MNVTPAIQEKIYLNIKSHHEHSDILYLHYFNSLIAVSLAIIGSMSFLILKYVESNYKISYIVLCLLAASFGCYTCGIYNHYLQNEKQRQKELIDCFDELKTICGESIYVLPSPFGEHKRGWSERDWSKLPGSVLKIYQSVLIIGVPYLIFTSVPCIDISR